MKRNLLTLRYEPDKIFYQDFLCRVKLLKKSNLEKQKKISIKSSELENHVIMGIRLK